MAKQFTAAAVVLLALDGKLSLDDPVRKYVPELPTSARRSLSGTSSATRAAFAASGRCWRWRGARRGAPSTPSTRSSSWSALKELNFKPGDEYLYNNTGFTLLSVVVERVSGKSFDEFCQERLFKPLGMTRTHWRTDFTEGRRGSRNGIPVAAKRQFRTNASLTNVVGNGGLLTTAGDWLIWNENLDNPRVGGRAMVEQLESRVGTQGVPVGPAVPGRGGVRGGTSSRNGPTPI